MKFLFAFVLLIIIALGIFFRYANLSEFTIYPDSYQNLLVAENLKNYGNVVGYLGQEGMVYPPFFMWTRPVYAVLINTVSMFGIDTTTAARSIAFVLGIASIPLAYFVYSNLFRPWTQFTLSKVEGFRGKLVGITASVLMAFSFNHTVWSGFIMTETTGVFFMLLFLWSLFRTLKKPTDILNPKDLLIGLLFGIAVLARYEYLIILIPVAFLVFNLSEKPLIRLLNIGLTTLFGLLIVGLMFYPWQSVLPVIFNQLTDMLIRAGVIAGSFSILFLILRFLPKKFKIRSKDTLPIAATGFVVVTAIYICALTFFGTEFWPLHHDLAFIRSFVQHDILLSIFTLIGIFLLLKDPKRRTYAYFSLIATISLLFIYHRINPEMERYLTHTIPFLLIPASYGVYTLLKIKNFKLKIFLPTLLILLLLQAAQTTNGLRYLQDSSWYNTSYEETIADRLRSWIPDQVRDDKREKLILLASMPEPYYYELKYSTHSINDNPPHIYIPDSLNSRKVLIIEDMGMRDIFPTFTKFLDTKLEKYKKTQFKINKSYHTANKSIKETEPVVIYEIELGELKKIIKEQ